MNKKDIDRLLTCREAIDDTRIAKQQTRDTYEKVAITTMQDKMAELITSREKILSDNGFKGVAEFLQFNHDMCMELIREYRTAYGECDLCNGYTDGLPPCTLTCKSGSLYETHNKVNKEELYELILLSARELGLALTPADVKAGYVHMDSNGISKDLIINKGLLYWVCPPGHGIYFRGDVLDADFPFSIGWK